MSYIKKWNKLRHGEEIELKKRKLKNIVENFLWAGGLAIGLIIFGELIWLIIK